MSESTPRPAAAPETTFEQALERLDEIVHDLEEGRIGLADSLARYEHGVQLLKQCYALLERAERRIELLSGADSRGRAVTEAFDDQVMSLEEKAQARGRRRSKKNSLPNEASESSTKRPNEIDESGQLF